MRIQLNGTVTSNDSADIYRWWGYKGVCCPNDIRDALATCPEDEELVMEINSGGGSVYAGFEMYNLIRSSGRKVTAEIQSLAGSAMSVIVSACSKVLMSPVSNIMIHRSSIGYTEGNAEKLEQDAQMLNTMDASILNAYCEKVGDKTSRTKLRHMMEDETFLTAQEAIECGLADGILEAGSGSADPTSAVACIANGMPQVLAAAVTLPPIEDLKRQKDEIENETDSEDTSSAVKNNNAEEREKMEITDIKTTEELKAAFPELTKQMNEKAQADERARITGIDEVAMPGFESIVTAAKADPSKTAGDVAKEIIAQQKQQGANYLSSVSTDVTKSKVNAIAADAPEQQELTPEQEAQAAAVADVKRWKEGK